MSDKNADLRFVPVSEPWVQLYTFRDESGGIQITSTPVIGWLVDAWRDASEDETAQMIGAPITVNPEICRAENDDSPFDLLVLPLELCPAEFRPKAYTKDEILELARAQVERLEQKQKRAS